MSELEKFIRDGGHIVKNGKRLFSSEDGEKDFIILVDFDSNNDKDIELSFEAGYFYHSDSFKQAYKELCKK